MTFSTTFLAACLLVGVGAPFARAQSRPPAGSIDGIVTDTNAAPLAAATVSLFNSGIRVVTGANGRFRILDLPAGSYVLMVRKLGYASTSTVMQVAEHDTLRASFALERVTVELDTMKVSAIYRSTRLAEFDERRKLGEGHFVTQAEIESRNVVFVADLLRPILSVSIRDGSAGQFAFSLRGAKSFSQGQCPFQVFLDGIPVLPAPANLANFPGPKELAGIEVYAGAATIPLRYKRSDSGCGVILLWTRDGS